MQRLRGTHGRCNLLVIIANKAGLCWTDKQSSLSCGCLVWIIATICGTPYRKRQSRRHPCIGVGQPDIADVFLYAGLKWQNERLNEWFMLFCLQSIKVDTLSNWFQDCFFPSNSEITSWYKLKMTLLPHAYLYQYIFGGKQFKKNSKVVAKALLYIRLLWKYLQNAASSNSRNPVNTVVPLPNTKRPFGPLQMCARGRVSEVLKFFYVFKCTLSTLLSWITCYFWVIYIHVSQQLRLLWAVCTNYEFLFSFYFISEACLNSNSLEDSTLRLFLLFAASTQHNIPGPSIYNYAWSLPILSFFIFWKDFGSFKHSPEPSHSDLVYWVYRSYGSRYEPLSS